VAYREHVLLPKTTVAQQLAAGDEFIACHAHEFAAWNCGTAAEDQRRAITRLQDRWKEFLLVHVSEDHAGRSERHPWSGPEADTSAITRV